MLVRSNGLEDSMSRYLIRRIEDTPSIVVHTHTEIAKLEGGDSLESVRWRNNKTEMIDLKVWFSHSELLFDFRTVKCFF